MTDKKIISDKKKTEKPKRKSAVKGLAWTFPKNSLEDAITLAKSIDEKNAGKPMKAQLLAQAMGYSVKDWRFLDLLRSANQYGLVSGTGAMDTDSADPCLHGCAQRSEVSKKNKARNQVVIT